MPHFLIEQWNDKSHKSEKPTKMYAYACREIGTIGVGRPEFREAVQTTSMDILELLHGPSYPTHVPELSCGQTSFSAQDPKFDKAIHSEVKQIILSLAEGVAAHLKNHPVETVVQALRNTKDFQPELFVPYLESLTRNKKWGNLGAMGVFKTLQYVLEEETIMHPDDVASSHIAKITPLAEDFGDKYHSPAEIKKALRYSFQTMAGNVIRYCHEHIEFIGRNKHLNDRNHKGPAL